MASARKAEEAFVQQLRAEVPGDGWRLFGGRNWSQLQLAVLGQAPKFCGQSRKLQNRTRLQEHKKEAVSTFLLSLGPGACSCRPLQNESGQSDGIVVPGQESTLAFR